MHESAYAAGRGVGVLGGSVPLMKAITEEENKGDCCP